MTTGRKRLNKWMLWALVAAPFIWLVAAFVILPLLSYSICVRDSWKPCQ